MGVEAGWLRVVYHHAAISMLGQVELGRPFQPDTDTGMERTTQLASPCLGTSHALEVGERGG
jgi:hypothetical protein